MRKFTKTETVEIEALHKWFEFNDNDWGMETYRTNRTQYIDFLEIVELETFKEITEELYQSYRKVFPYSTRKDFINHVFYYTIIDLEKFLSLHLRYLGKAPNEEDYLFYTAYLHEDGEFIDFAINNKLYIENYKQYYKDVLEYLKSFENDNTKQAIPPHPINDKPKPELNEALILFSNTEIIESLYNELKGYFQGKEAELKKALQGKRLQEFLLFPHHQNKFVEVFKRLKYNGFLLSTPKETKDWICATFAYQHQKGNKKEVRKFNTSTVHDILTKDKGEPTKKERICIVDWLPYKSHLTRQREAEKESI
tara:strand:+ start:1 stop:930 length:930 start_codon:yes stop_codon:yes gene_type:complete